MRYSTQIASPLGMLFLVSDGAALLELKLEGQKYFDSPLPAEPVSADALPIFAQTERWLRRYFAGEAPSPEEIPLAPEGSDFRRAVWRRLLEIPYGQVTTYGQIAQSLQASRGCRVSARAVGGAVGHNPISILIPCHRVIGADGSLTGYAGGLERKRWLLALEGQKFPIFCKNNT